MKTFVRHCSRIITPGKEIPGASLLLEDGRISALLPADAPVPRDARVVDGDGLTVVPGFFDIHTHGADGVDTCDGSVDSIRHFAEIKLREGVTSLFPTTLTLPAEPLRAAARSVARYRENPEFARVPGLHVEGPFINPRCAGAQNPAFTRLPDADELLALHAICPVSIVSLAAELPGALDFIRTLRRHGIVTSLAHTAATAADYSAARAAGLTHLTHFCNQMSPLHHREIGVVGSGLLDSDVRIELICDGVHLCADMLRLVFALKPVHQIMLITDSMAAAWRPDGNYELAGLPVSVTDGQARLASGALAGSTLRYDRGLALVHQLTGRPLHEIIATTSLNQASSLGIKEFGEVSPGFAADLVLLDENLAPRCTLVGGKVKWTA